MVELGISLSKIWLVYKYLANISVGLPSLQTHEPLFPFQTPAISLIHFPESQKYSSLLYLVLLTHNLFIFSPKPGHLEQFF